jgi:hypothetical protein
MMLPLIYHRIKDEITMNSNDMDKFELFLDKLSSIVMDSVTNEEVMKMVKDEVWWGGEAPFFRYPSDEKEKEIKKQEEIYIEFLKVVDLSYFAELAEIEAIKKEIHLVV